MRRWNSICLTVAVLLLAVGAAHAECTRAMLMITSGESAKCATGNVNVAWVAIIRKSDNSMRSRRYVSSIDGCAILPIKAPIGTQITISGIMGDRLATHGLSPTPSTPTVTEGCFNNEVFSLGLETEGAIGQLDPQDPNDIINSQGYGLAWAQTDIDGLSGGTAQTFKVVGCGHNCQKPLAIFNTDFGTIPNPGCPVLPAIR
jgi:hypothetical protein